MKTRIHSFTLVEFLVALVLSSVAFTVGWFAMRGAQSLYLQFNRQYRFLCEAARLNRQIEHLFTQSDYIQEIQSRVFTAGNEDRCTYIKILENGVALERPGNSDTIRISPQNVVVTYDSSNPSSVGVLVSALRFDVEFGGELFQFEFRKQHDAVRKLILAGVDESTGN